MRLKQRVRRLSRLIEVAPPEDMGFLPANFAEDIAGVELSTMAVRDRLAAHARYREQSAPVFAEIDAAMKAEAEALADSTSSGPRSPGKPQGSEELIDD
ncbi:MAG: hypothetical protein V3W41_17965 [Planctomycetota bacterium]